MINKKRVEKKAGSFLQKKVSNRLAYTIISLTVLILFGVIVYAVIPNPGHAISSIEPPNPCSSGQFLQWTGSAWACATPSGAPPAYTAPVAPSGLNVVDVYYDYLGTKLYGHPILEWTDNSNDEDSFEPWYSRQSSTSGFSRRTVLSQDYTLWDDDIRLPEDAGTYWYKVRACNSYGCSDYSNVVSVYVGNP